MVNLALESPLSKQGAKEVRVVRSKQSPAQSFVRSIGCKKLQRAVHTPISRSKTVWCVVSIICALPHPEAAFYKTEKHPGALLRNLLPVLRIDVWEPDDTHTLSSFPYFLPSEARPL